MSGKAQSGRGRGYSPRYLGIASMAIASAFVLGACSSAAESTVSEETTEEATSTETTEEVSGPADSVAAAEALYLPYLEEPSWNGPTEPVSVAGLEGKRVIYISVDDGIPVLNYWSTLLTEILAEYGVEMEIVDAKGSVDEANRGFQQAIATNADIVFTQAFYTDIFANQIAEAQAAGLKVITGNSGSMTRGLTGGQDVEVSFDYEQVGRLVAQWFVIDSGGQGNALVISSDDVPASEPQWQATVSEIEALCPDCTVTVEDVQIPQWATSIPTLFQSTINNNPETTYLLPIYDGQSLPGLGAIRQAGAGETVSVGTFNASPGIVELLNDDTSGLKLDVGGDNTWWSYAAADAIFRALQGVEPIDNYNIGLRAFDQSNKDIISSNSDEKAWYGYTGYADEFRALWTQ
jgi:ribose transport system substrate-binding protein